MGFLAPHGAGTYRMETHNLKFHRLPFELNGTNLEIHTNRGDITLGVRVVSEPKEQAGLGGVSQETGAVEGMRSLTLPTPESPMRRSLKR